MTALQSSTGVPERMATSQIQFKSDGFSINAFLARPDTAAVDSPAVVILHEWWGLNDHVKDIARRFAAEGFVAMVPDLYARQAGRVTTDAAEAAKLMSTLQSQTVLRDVNTAVQALRAQPGVRPPAIGIVGFGMGGTHALTQACHNSDLKTAIAFYGKVPLPESIRYFLCPIQYHWGANDDWITKAEVDGFREALAKFGKPGEIQVYPNAGQAFFNDTRADKYSPEDAKAAWQATLRCLRRYLK